MLRCMNEMVLPLFPFVDVSHTFQGPLAAGPYEAWDGATLGKGGWDGVGWDGMGWDGMGWN